MTLHSQKYRNSPAIFKFDEHKLYLLIPVRLKTDTCPRTGADGADPFWVADEEVPGALAGVDDGLVGVPDQVAELVAAQVFPDILHRVQLRRIGRQRQ